MTQNIKIYNSFGIVPTNNFISAGSDFYVPYFDEDKKDVAFAAFGESFGKSEIELNNILTIMRAMVTRYHGETTEQNMLNIVHLYLAMHSAALESYNNSDNLRIDLFASRYLTFDKNEIPGVKMELNDTLLINSGIRVALHPGTAGIFFNKSGKGNAGFDVRAQVVDEDYTGNVHLSVAFTKDTDSSKRIVYCGDKITQMVILPVINATWEEIDPKEYFELMSNSNRGFQAFGSSDVKH